LPPGEEALHQEIADANRRAEDALREAAAARDQQEALRQRNAELVQSLRERQATLDELEVWRSELERRLASMSTELGETTARLRAAEQELAGLDVAPPSDAPTDMEELRRRAALEAAEAAARELAEAIAGRAEPGL
jgi:chromosome segregation ATPase